MGDVDELRAAVANLDVAAAVRVLDRAPDLLPANPDFSAQMLSLAIRMISCVGDQRLRGEPARVVVQAHRAVFDLLLDRGASVNCGPGLEDLPPLLVAVQMTHPVLAEELLARGADPNQEIIGLTPAAMNPDPAFHEVLRKYGARDC